MSFADIEARVNTSVFARLVNAEASFAHAGQVEPVLANVVFDAATGHVDDFGTVAMRPTLLMQPTAAPLTAEGDLVTLTSLNQAATALGEFTVRSVVLQAEGGWQRVTLARN